MSSLRRFVYLVTGDQRRRAYLLRRIDTSRCFLPRRDLDRLLTDTPPPLEEARLPPATMKFDPHSGDIGPGCMNFMLFAAGGRRNMNTHHHHRVLTADRLGRALLYDPESTSVHAMPSLTAPKFAAASITVGDEVYVLDASTTYRNHQRHCFEVFVHRDGEWHCHHLPPPPYVVHQPGAYRAVSYAVVGGGGSSIWVSSSELDAGSGGVTYSFDTAPSGGAWTWAEAGDWAMPFNGQAHHVPEHGVWVGLSAGDGCYGDDDGSVCAADLTAADGDLIWRYPAPPRWKNRVCHLVHLGGSRFCHARFFEVTRSCDVNSRKYVVLTGIEVARCGDGEGEGEDGDGGELCVVKHRSLQYRLPDSVLHWVF